MELQIPLPPGMSLPTALSCEEYEQLRCDAMNAEEGVLPGKRCEICRNKGLVYYRKGSEILCRPCACMTEREGLERIRKSGLSETLELYTFASFEAAEEWQKKMKREAMEYAENPDGWLLVCGQVGAGKTHLCTAVVGALMKRGRSARYMLWRDDVVKLKACVNDEAAYNRLMRPLKEVDVLYIDDFFKTASGVRPTQGDINVAFELINSRYCRKDAITVLSCELTISELLGVDEATCSRIYQRTKGHSIEIQRDRERNYRLKKG